MSLVLKSDFCDFFRSDCGLWASRFPFSNRVCACALAGLGDLTET